VSSHPLLFTANKETVKRRSIFVNKTEFIERVAEEADVPVSEAQRYFDAVENVVTSALKGGEEDAIDRARREQSAGVF
jgi:Bacterial DNA-binding protein